MSDLKPQLPSLPSKSFCKQRSESWRSVGFDDVEVLRVVVQQYHIISVVSFIFMPIQPPPMKDKPDTCKHH